MRAGATANVSLVSELVVCLLQGTCHKVYTLYFCFGDRSTYRYTEINRFIHVLVAWSRIQVQTVQVARCTTSTRTSTQATTRQTCTLLRRTTGLGASVRAAAALCLLVFPQTGWFLLGLRVTFARHRRRDLLPGLQRPSGSRQHTVAS